jgi:hypothetical protein
MRVVAAALLVLVCVIAARTADAALGDCGQPVSNGANPTASDCLFILKTAVGSQTCDPVCVCDTNGAGGVSASDALVCLKKAVGQGVTLACPTPCGSTTTTTLGDTQPTLTAGDFPLVSPCEDRDTLPNDATFIATINAATKANVIVNFTQYDAQGMPEICGLTDVDNDLANNDVPWDPNAGNTFHVCSTFSSTLADYFANFSLGHSPDMCRTGTDLSSLAMPRAGTYRKDACIEANNNAYDVRTRVTVSGASVDKTFAQLGIQRTDLKACDGTTEIATTAAAKAFLGASPTDTTFTIVSGSCSGGTEHLEVHVEVICVDKRSSACPPPNFGNCG